MEGETTMTTLASSLQTLGRWRAPRPLAVALGAALLAGCAAQPVTPAAGPDPTRARDAQELVEKARLSIEGFDAGPADPQFRDMVKRARGVLIFPSTFRAAFIVGGQGGSGVLLVRDAQETRWKGPAFYTLGGVSVGFQAGAESAEVVSLVMTERGMTALLNPTVTLGGDVSVTAGPVGAGVGGATAGLSADIVSYARSKGIYAGVSLQGGVASTRNDLNAAYYGRPVTATDILVRGEVQNPQAAPLIAEVARLTGTPVATGG
jgi:lipid-binding SYLF domain-containing protein